MKFYTKTITGAFAFFAITLQGCDNIGEDERYIALPAIEANRVVLVEEFTGQNCVNCPEAHTEMSKLLEQYPDNVIAVSIHGGPLAMSEVDFPSVGLATADGDAYFSESKVPAPPAAVVNRTTGVIYKDQWGAAVRKEVARTTNLDIKVSAVSGEDGSINIETIIEPYDNIKGSLQLWVVENGIRTLQITEEGFKADYPHSHVLRGAVNGHNGEKIELLPRESVQLTHSLQPKDFWKVENLEIVAFVYDATGVLQATKCEVK